MHADESQTSQDCTQADGCVCHLLQLHAGQIQCVLNLTVVKWKRQFETFL